MGGWVGGGVRVDVREELKFLGNFTQKKNGGGGGVRVDVNEELKFLGKFTKKNSGGSGGGVGLVGGGQGGCERNVGGRR